LAVFSVTILETCGFAFSYILKIYIATGQALYDDFLLKFFYLSVVHDGVLREQLQIYNTFNTAKNNAHPFLGPKTISLFPNLAIDTQF
jgi:hypothetical protein